MIRASAILLCVLIAAGCASAPKPQIYTADNPGPWKDVQIVTKFTDGEVTIAVKDFPLSPTNYVLKFSLTDQRGQNVGERIFAADDEPAESFFLYPESRSLIITVSSTGQGQWVTGTIPIPPPAPKTTPLVPPK